MAVCSPSLKVSVTRERFRLRRDLLKRRFKESQAVGQAGGGDPNSAKTIEALTHDAAQLRETIIRQKAEFDNFRKRTLKEKEQIRVAAQEDMIANLLPVIDNFQRALDSSAKATEPGPIREGVEMVAGQMMRILEGGGLTRIEALNAPFDPQLHEALAMEEREDVPENHVSEVMLPGYRFRDKVLRAAMVKVARSPAGTKA